VGWLDDGDYLHGEVPAHFLVKLAELISREPVNQMRHIDPCPICGEEGIRASNAGTELFLGTAEVWVPSPEGIHVYAAPDLVWHFVDQHGYLPPHGFVEAVMNVSTTSDWSGERLREVLVAELYRPLPKE